MSGEHWPKEEEVDEISSSSMEEQVGFASSQAGSSDFPEEQDGFDQSPTKAAEMRSNNTNGEGTVSVDDPSASSSSTGSDEANAALPSKKSGKKPKSESSVVHDQERGVCTCKRCGWIYPNPRPSAKLRREHKKQCGKFQDVHAWLSLEQKAENREEEQGMELQDQISQSEDNGSVKVLADDSSSNDTSEQEQDKLHQISDREVSEKVPMKKIEDQAPVSGITKTLADDDQAGSFSQAHDEVPMKKIEDQAPVSGIRKTLADDDQAGSSSQAHDEVPMKKIEDQAPVSGITTENMKTLADDDQAGSSSQVHELERILKEQTSHDLLCPNCGSCITRRVILKKRKRTGSAAFQKQQQEDSAFKQPKIEQSTEDDERSTVIQRELEEIGGGDDQAEAWGCLACFSIFFRKVETEDSDQRLSCLPYLLPDFHWDGEGLRLRTSEEEAADRQSSSCLPIEFPWSWKTKTIDINQPVQEQQEVVSEIQPTAVTLAKKDESGLDSTQTLQENLEVEEPKVPKEKTTDSELQVSVSDVGEDDQTQTSVAESSKVSEGKPPDGNVDRQSFSWLHVNLIPWRKTQTTADEIREKEEQTKEIEVVIDLTGPQKTVVLPEIDISKTEAADSDQQNMNISEASQEEEQRDRFSCLPVLLPTYWREADLALQQAELQQEDESEGGFDCLSALLPDYRRGTVHKQTARIDEKQPVQEKPEAAEEIQEEQNQSAKDEVSDKETGIDDTRPVKAAEEILEEQNQASKDEVSDEVSDEARIDDTHPVQVEFEVAEEQDQASKDQVSEHEASQEVADSSKDETCNCFPLSLAKSWNSSQTASPVNEEIQESQTKAGLNCLPLMLPSYLWDGDEKQVKTDLKKEDSACLPITLPAYSWKSDGSQEPDQEQQTYVTKETTIRAWIKTITSVVTVRPRRTDTVQVGNATRFVDMTVSEQSDGLGKKNSAQALVTTPSTGWALLDALDKDKRTAEQEATDDEEDLEEDEDVRLINNRKKLQQREIQEIEDLPSSQLQQDQLYDLRQPLLPAEEEQNKELDVEALLSAMADQPAGVSKPPSGSTTATVSVKSSDSLVQVTGGDPKQAVETALAIAEVLPDEQLRQQDSVQEYVKSIVYGGLDVTLTSLAVISSGAGSGTKTINILAISLANLVAGLISLFHNIGSLYQRDRSSFEQYIGQSLWINGSISVISFLFFGCIAPLTYALSFRSADDRDYKFAATAMTSLACLCLMGLGKAYVQKTSGVKGYAAIVVNLVLTGFVASIAGYFVGDYVNRWLQKIGYEDQPPSPPSLPPPSPPFFLSELGRRGRASQ